ncbi:MAG: SRPBCC family protein [Pseudomonadota bacterium]
MSVILSILKWVGIAIAVLIGLGFVLPDRQTVERSVTINADPETVFSLIGDFNNWDSWSPWADKDPNMQVTVQGSGLGQSMSWVSEDPNVGVGSQEIIEFSPNSNLVMALDFGDMGKAEASFILAPGTNGGTEVMWTLDTNMREGVPFLMKPMATYMGFMMDKMVGQDYEKGLSQLKAAAESAS